MEDFSEVFNGLSTEQKRKEFILIYNLMDRYHRFCGWIRFFGDHFMFFDSKPSHEDAIWVNKEELKEWIDELDSELA